MSFLGRFLVEQGAITEEQLADGLRYQRENNRRIGEVAVDRGMLTPEQVRDICGRQDADPRLFGDLAVDERQLTRRSLNDLLFFQKIHHTYLGEALLVLGHIDRGQYRQLMGRHYALRDQGRVSLRYLQEFFSENRVAEILFAAVARVVRRHAGEELAICSLGGPDGRTDYAGHAVLQGRVLGGRRFSAAIGLSGPLADRLAASMAEVGTAAGLDVFFDTVLRFFGDMLRDDALLLEEGRVVREQHRPPGQEDSLGIYGQTPTGTIGMDFWLEEAPA